MPISSNGSQLIVTTVVGDQIYTNVDSSNPLYGANQQREERQTPATGCMKSVFGKNIVREDERVPDATPSGSPQVDERLAAANKKDLRKRNIK